MKERKLVTSDWHEMPDHLMVFERIEITVTDFVKSIALDSFELCCGYNSVCSLATKSHTVVLGYFSAHFLTFIFNPCPILI